MKNKVILFTVNVDWFFLSHRLNLATEALKNGYEVHLAASFTDHKSHIESLGIHVHDLDISRILSTYLPPIEDISLMILAFLA